MGDHRITVLTLIYIVPLLLVHSSLTALFVFAPTQPSERASEHILHKLMTHRRSALYNSSEQPLIALMSQPIVRLAQQLSPLVPAVIRSRASPLAPLRYAISYITHSPSIANAAIFQFTLIIFRKNIKHRVCPNSHPLIQIEHRHRTWKATKYALAASIAFSPPFFLSSLSYSPLPLSWLLICLMAYLGRKPLVWTSGFFGAFAMATSQQAVFFVMADCALIVRKCVMRQSYTRLPVIHLLALSLSTLFIPIVKFEFHPVNLPLGLSAVALILGPGTIVQHWGAVYKMVGRSMVIFHILVPATLGFMWVPSLPYPTLPGPLPTLIRIGLIAGSVSGWVVIWLWYIALGRSSRRVTATIILIGSILYTLTVPGIASVGPGIAMVSSFMYIPSMPEKALHPVRQAALVTVHQITSIISAAICVAVAGARLWAIHQETATCPFG